MVEATFEVVGGAGCPICTPLVGDRFTADALSSEMIAGAFHNGCQHGIEKVRTEPRSPVAAALAANSAKFRSAGGTLEIAVTEEGRQQAAYTYDAMRELMMEDDPDWGRKAGPQFTMFALHEETVHIANVDGTGIAGAIGTWVREMDDIVPTTVFVEYLGSTGIAPGTGSALVSQTIKDAAARGVGVSLSPTAEAVPFWAKMGMREDPWDVGASDWGMLADEVAAIAKELP